MFHPEFVDMPRANCPVLTARAGFRPMAQGAMRKATHYREKTP